MIPAVVLSTHTTGLAVIRSLGRMNVPVTAVTYQDVDMGFVSKYVNEVQKFPDPIAFPEQFTELLISLGRKHGKAVLFPADDQTLVLVSKNKKILGEYYFVGCPGYDIVQKYINKNLTYEIAEKIGVLAPHTFSPVYHEEAEIQAKYISFPCLIKPVESHRYFEAFRKKMVLVTNKKELLKEFDKAASYGLRVMIQELIPGKETAGINYNSFMVNGEVVQDFTAEKIRLTEYGLGIPVVVKSRERIENVAAAGKKILKEIGYTGYSCTEFKRDYRTGEYVLMEVNGRHNRSSMLALKAGLNFPMIEYNYLTEGILPKPTDYKKNIYWIDEFRDFNGMHDRLFRKHYRFNEFITPYLHKHVFAVFSLSDPKPAFRRLGLLFSIIKNKINNLFGIKRRGSIKYNEQHIKRT